MESLPLEMVVKISKDLTPEDLAHCCGVSTTWREIFNEDCLWKPSCNHDLEKYLRITPCVVEPAFIKPEGESSTLAPISRWRLAFLREKHLYQNFKRNNFKEDESLLLYRHLDAFLTETHIVRWSGHGVEIWDVTMIPAKLVIETDILDMTSSLIVLDNSTLLVERKNCLTVLEVDLKNKCLYIKHDIPVAHNFGLFVRPCILKGRMLLYLDGKRRTKLIVFDIDTGNKLKEEQQEMLFQEIKSSPNSDDVVVEVFEPGNQKSYDYVYSPKNLCFLLGPLARHGSRMSVINGKYLAVCGVSPVSLKIYNYHTSEVIIEISDHDIKNFEVSVFNDGFIFIEHLREEENRLKMFSPTNRTMITLFGTFNSESFLELRGYCLKSFEVINGKFLHLYTFRERRKVYLGTWMIRSGKLSKISNDFDSRIVSHWCTKSLAPGIFHYW